MSAEDLSEALKKVLDARDGKFVHRCRIIDIEKLAQEIVTSVEADKQ